MKRILAAFLFAALVASALFAEEFGPVSIERVPQASDSVGRSGYFIAEFRVANRSAEPAEVRMRLYSRSGFGYSAERTLLFAPGAVRNVTLYWPPELSMHWRHTGIEPVLGLVVNGKPRKNTLLSASGFFGWSDGGIFGNILVSGMVPEKEYQPYFVEPVKPWMARGLVTSDIPVAQWGVHLRDYSSADTVWISSEDRVPPEVERTLSNWVFAGGTLVVIVPPGAAWPEGTEPSDAKPRITRHGWGTRVLMRPVPAAGLKKESEKAESTPGLRYLEGQVKDVGGGNSFRQVTPDTYWALLKLPIPDVPLQLLFLVMVAFVLLIGPANFFLLRKFRKEPLILVTTPVISLVFCLLVIGFITLGEGWHSRAKALGVTLLDQDTKLAATRAMMAVYSPVPPRTGYEFDSEDVLRFAGAGNLELREDSSQRLSSGLLRPRLPLGCSIERVSMQREHLKLTREKDGVGVVNGLGVRLASLSVVAPDGWVYDSEGAIEPGARAVLRRSQSVRDCGLDWSDIHKKLLADKEKCRAAGLIPHGYYLAIASEPVFWTPGFKPDQFEVLHAVIGKFSFAGEAKDGN